MNKGTHFTGQQLKNKAAASVGSGLFFDIKAMMQRKRLSHQQLFTSLNDNSA